MFAEAKDWLNKHRDWSFAGELLSIPHKELIKLADKLYQAGCEEVALADFSSQIDLPDDDAEPDMFIISLPKDMNKRQSIFRILNTPDFWQKKRKFEDDGKDSFWYFFEPSTQSITVGNKKITWYSSAK